MKTVTIAALALVLVSGCAQLKEQFSNTSPAAGASSSQGSDKTPSRPYPYNAPWG